MVKHEHNFYPTGVNPFAVVFNLYADEGEIEMSILINMEMPTSCDSCRFMMLEVMMLEDTNCAPELFCGCPIVLKANPQGIDHRPDYCPLVPVPPHGDLIDRDELLKRFCGHCFDEHDPDWDFRQCEGECFDLKLIKNTPTIIEAEEKKT